MGSAGRIQVIAIIVFALAFLSCVAHGDNIRELAETTGAAVAITVFNVTEYGAVADDATDNVEAFMQAWRAACDSNAPAKMVIPGGTYLTGPVIFQGPCNSTGPIIFEVQGLVKATTDLSEYSEDQWILFEKIDGLILKGRGTFDGQGAEAWQYNDCKTNKNCMRLPSSLKLSKVNNSAVYEISSINSKYFHMHVTNCNNVQFYSLNISAPGNSPNTDGMHISHSNLINVTSSVIGTGDDCISIGQGAFNISVYQIICGPGHGISVGSLGKYKQEEDVNGVVVSNCTLFNTTNGVRIKTYSRTDPSQATNIIFEDIIMDTVQNPIIIDQSYGTRQKGSSQSQVKISNIRYKNIKGTSTSDVAVSLLCSSVAPCEGVELLDVDLAYNGLKPNLTLSTSCLNANITANGTQNPTTTC